MDYENNEGLGEIGTIEMFRNMVECWVKTTYNKLVGEFDKSSEMEKLVDGKIERDRINDIGLLKSYNIVKKEFPEEFE